MGGWGGDGGPWGRFREAAGLAHLRPGFCHTPDHDALFALGWPHLRLLHGGGADLRADLARLAAGEEPGEVGVGRETARRLVRGWGAAEPFELGARGPVVRPEAARAAAQGGPVGLAEAQGIVRRRLGREAPGLPPRAASELALLVEALVGAEPVGEVVVDALEGEGAEALRAPRAGAGAIVATLGFLLLRVPPLRAAGWRRRLRVVLDRAAGPGPTARLPRSPARALAWVLDGPDAVRDGDDAPEALLHAQGDAALVRAAVATAPGPLVPDARLAFLGGRPVLARLVRAAAGLGSAARLRLFREVAPIRAPETTRLARGLAGSPGPDGDAARAWLARYGAVFPDDG